MDVSKHFLVPPHRKLTDAEKQKVFEQFQAQPKDLPKILKSDPALAKLNTKAGDLIAIERKSKTAGISTYYRVVLDG